MILGFSVLPEGEGMIPVPGYPDRAEQIAAVAIVFFKARSLQKPTRR